MQHRPAEQEKHHHAAPEDPLILLRAPLDHADGVPADAERAGHVVQLALRALQHLALRAQVPEHGAPTLQVLVELRVALREEGLLAQRVVLARALPLARAEGEIAVGGARGGGGKGGLLRGERGGGVGVLGGGCLVWAAAEELGAVRRRLLSAKVST